MLYIDRWDNMSFDLLKQYNTSLQKLVEVPDRRSQSFYANKFTTLSDIKN